MKEPNPEQGSRVGRKGKDCLENPVGPGSPEWGEHVER